MDKINEDYMEMPMPCCNVVSVEWYVGEDGQLRFICPRCRSVYVVSKSNLKLENDKRIRIKVKKHE